MKIAYVTRAYPGVVEEFYAARPGLERESSEAQRVAWEEFAFGWAGAWAPALAPLGHAFEEAWLDLEPMLRAWARENGVAEESPPEFLAAERVRAFAPDVLWFDDKDAELLTHLRGVCPGLRAVVGWVGSALPDLAIWGTLDLVLSCDAASVETLRNNGVRAELLHHAFQERVLDRLADRPPRYDVAFAGQFDPGAPAHGERERVLEALLAAREVAVFSPASRRPGAAEERVKQAAWHAARSLRGIGVPETAVRSLPGIGRAAAWPAPPRGELPPRLAKAVQPARYGLDMYQTLRDARVSLNVQGAGRPQEASNMRLFEATGVGSALLTDRAQSIASLFESGREVVTFATPEECVEKVGWLLEHEAERAAIAKAGQARCLAEHTFAKRAVRLEEILRGAMR